MDASSDIPVGNFVDINDVRISAAVRNIQLPPGSAPSFRQL